MHDLLIQVIFYSFAGLALASALMVITQNNPVRCVLFLVVTFLASAVLWILAEAEFLALILVLVYVGAVMTLFLFVVMMLNIDTESMKSHLFRYLPLGLILVALLTGLLMIAMPENMLKSSVENLSSQVISSGTTLVQTAAMPVARNVSNTEALGKVLYTDYVLAFEMASALLLVAIISAITLAHRRVVRVKQQDIIKQIMIDPKDRVTLVSMKSEK